MLPSGVASMVAMGICKLIGGLYQIANVSRDDLRTYEAYLADPTGAGELALAGDVQQLLLMFSDV